MISMCVPRPTITTAPLARGCPNRNSPAARCRPPRDQECLTPETTLDMLKACEADEPLPMKTWGSRPMNGQESCEGPQGQTTLAGKITGPICRDLGGEKVRGLAVRLFFFCNHGRSRVGVVGVGVGALMSGRPCVREGTHDVLSGCVFRAVSASRACGLQSSCVTHESRTKRRNSLRIVFMLMASIRIPKPLAPTHQPTHQPMSTSTPSHVENLVDDGREDAEPDTAQTHCLQSRCDTQSKARRKRGQGSRSHVPRRLT